MSLAGLTIAGARALLHTGDLGAVELAEACLSAAEGSAALNAFSALTPELARAQARTAEARLRAGDASTMRAASLKQIIDWSRDGAAE